MCGTARLGTLYLTWNVLFFMRWQSLAPGVTASAWLLQGSPDCWDGTLIQPCDHTSQCRTVPEDIARQREGPSSGESLLSILQSVSSPTLSYYISSWLKTEHSLCF